MTPNERPTPLTDAFWKAMIESNPPMLGAPEYDFARTLERSLAERTEERDKANEKLRTMASPAVHGVLAKMAAPPMAQAMDDMRKNLEILDRVKSERATALAKLEEVSKGLVAEVIDHCRTLTKLAKCREALESIARYDKDSKHGDGICPYGCDTPSIARQTLEETK